MIRLLICAIVLINMAGCASLGAGKAPSVNPEHGWSPYCDEDPEHCVEQHVDGQDKEVFCLTEEDRDDLYRYIFYLEEVLK